MAELLEFEDFGQRTFYLLDGLLLLPVSPPGNNPQPQQASPHK
jgi:hypothetical protein